MKLYKKILKERISFSKERLKFIINAWILLFMDQAGILNIHKRRIPRKNEITDSLKKYMQYTYLFVSKKSSWKMWSTVIHIWRNFGTTDD